MKSLEQYKEIIDSHLTDLIPCTDEYSKTLTDAMRYSLEVGGKRLRPCLLLAACEFAGGSTDEALPYALALEYIHTYSLIHDDLPAMDNDDLRRGKPTNHKVYGEAMAILAGDGLLTTAAKIVSTEPLKYADPVKMKNHIRAASEIMTRAFGMVAGQTADVLGENMQATAGLVSYIEAHKTADLLAAPVRAGLMIAGADEKVIDSFTSYAENIGVAFQILDDILDVEGDTALMGKTLGKDAEQGKCSYVYVHGIDAAKAELHRLTSEAVNAVESYGDDAVFFTELAGWLESRDH
ncbi:MAG: polyprenyl synthetase family protein [Mogibacterium sp.]|nr:polyprenyl synthetase family protein [Mogibacterium sp.]